MTRHQSLLAVLSTMACLLCACDSLPPSRFAQQRELGPCSYEVIGGVDHHAVKIEQQPSEKGFASGDFDATVTVWVTTGKGTKLQRIDIPNNKLVMPIVSDDGLPVVAVAIQGCVAYEALVVTARRKPGVSQRDMTALGAAQ